MDVLLNWLWQGVIVAIALAVMLRPLRGARADVRYGVCWVALALIIVLPLQVWLGGRDVQPAALAAVPSGVISLPSAWWTSATVIISAWAVWVGVYAFRIVRALYALARARRDSQPFPPVVEASLSNWQRVRSRGRRPVLMLSDTVATAAVLGGTVPVIAVSRSLVDTLDHGELDQVVVHEWAHVQRRDDLVNLLQVALRAIVGWHPAVWWIDRRLHVEREIACDEMTMAVTGATREYAECLVKLASVRGANRSTLPAPAMLGASGLRTRIVRIVSRHAAIGRRRAYAIAGAAIAGLCALSVVAGAMRVIEPALLANALEATVLHAPRIAPIRAIAEAVSVSGAQPAQDAAPRPTPVPMRGDDGERSTLASSTPPLVYSTPQLPEPGGLATAVPAAVVSNAADGERSTGTTSDDGVMPDASAPQATPQIASQPPAAPAPSPWAVVADHGTSVGRTSKAAGLATAGLFTRFARGVAGSFQDR